MGFNHCVVHVAWLFRNPGTCLFNLWKKIWLNSSLEFFKTRQIEKRAACPTSSSFCLASRSSFSKIVYSKDLLCLSSCWYIFNSSFSSSSSFNLSSMYWTTSMICFLLFSVNYNAETSASHKTKENNPNLIKSVSRLEIESSSFPMTPLACLHHNFQALLPALLINTSTTNLLQQIKAFMILHQRQWSNLQSSAH